MKSKPNIGRRTLCTSEITKALCKYVCDACTLRTAAEAVGISLTSIHEWVRRGEAGEKPFMQFAEALSRARGFGKAKMVKSIIDSGEPRVLLEYLGRVYPNEYGRSEPRTIVINRPPPPVAPAEQPSRTTHYWTTKDNQIPLSRKQLEFIAQLRSQYPPALPSKKNGERVT